MKKTILMTAIIGACISLIACNNTAINNETIDSTITNNSSITNEITIEEAKEIALSHENLTNEQVIFERVEMDYDDGVKKYDVEFYYENKEYDYEISVSDGKILSYDYDAEYNNTQNTSTNDITVAISEEQAKEIALNHANLQSEQIIFERVEMDYDDGVKKYDVEFYLNNIEYNYEIDANTGNILSYDQD